MQHGLPNRRIRVPLASRCSKNDWEVGSLGRPSRPCLAEEGFSGRLEDRALHVQTRMDREELLARLRPGAQSSDRAPPGRSDLPRAESQLRSEVNNFEK